MSTVITVAQAGQAHLTAAGPVGFIDLITSKANAVTLMFRAVSVVTGMGFVIWEGLKSRGALARIIVAGIAAGVFIYIVFNVTSLQKRTKKEIEGLPSVASVVVHVDSSAPPWRAPQTSSQLRHERELARFGRGFATLDSGQYWSQAA